MNVRFIKQGKILILDLMAWDLSMLFFSECEDQHLFGHLI